MFEYRTQIRLDMKIRLEIVDVCGCDLDPISDNPGRPPSAIVAGYRSASSRRLIAHLNELAKTVRAAHNRTASTT